MKLNPNNFQKTYFAKCFGCKRFAYNWGVEQYNKNLGEGVFKNGYDLIKSVGIIYTTKKEASKFSKTKYENMKKVIQGFKCEIIEK